MDTKGRLIAGSHNRNEFVLINADEVARVSPALWVLCYCYLCLLTWNADFFHPCSDVSCFFASEILFLTPILASDSSPFLLIWLHIAWLPHKTGSLADFSCHVCNLLSHIFFIIPEGILKLQWQIVGEESFSLLFFIIWSFSFLVQMFLFIWSLVSWEIQLHRPDLGVTFTRSLSRFQS